jgi:molecular chaperone DnaK
LSEDEIQRMVKDAEAHAEDDRKFKELVDIRNQADAMIHSTTKSLKDLGDEVGADEKQSIEAAVEALKEAMKGNDKALMEGKTKELSEVSGKMAERVYAKKAQAEQPKEQAKTDDGKTSSKAGEEVVDAEYKEVDDDKK